MSALCRAALWIVRAGCSPGHVEEIEGDLLELHHRRLDVGDGESRRTWMLLPQAIRAVLGRPSSGLRRVALAATGAGIVFVAYVALALTQAERSWILWLIGLGVALEAYFWLLVFSTMRDRAGHES